MNKGLILSLLLHAGVIYALIYGVPNIGHETDQLEIPFAFDVIASETLTPKPAPRQQSVKPKPQQKPVPKPEYKPEKKPPQPEIKEVVEEEKQAPEPEVKPIPEEKKEPPKPTPLPEVKPKEKDPDPVPITATPIPRRKPIIVKSEDKETRKKEERFSSVLKDLKKMKEKIRVEGQQEEEEEDTEEEGQPGKLGEQLTASEIDAVRHQLAKCWNVPAGAKDGKELKVKVHLWLNPDGVVRQAKVLRDPFLQGHPFYKVAADRALNAVLDKKCNPLPLPKSKYDLWKEIVITFDPKDMLE